MSLYSPKGYLFVHNCKAGGTTVRNLLQGPLVRYLTVPHDPAIRVRNYMRNIGAEGQWNLAFKFGFVRDPYAWVESYRRHCVAQKDHPLNWVANEPASFPYWLARACERMVPTDNGPICFQRDMVLGQDGEQILDRICRFENYEGEVRWLCEHLGIECPEILPQTGINEVPSAEVIGAYKNAIIEHFIGDFTALGYTP